MYAVSMQQGSDQGTTGPTTAPHSFARTYVFSYVSPSHACRLFHGLLPTISFSYEDRYQIWPSFFHYKHYFLIHTNPKNAIPFTFTLFNSVRDAGQPT